MFKPKIYALFSSIAVVAATVAAATDIRPVLPPVEYPDTEVVTNVAVSAQGSREYAFELAIRLRTSGRVREIAFCVLEMALTKIAHAHLTWSYNLV